MDKHADLQDKDHLNTEQEEQKRDIQESLEEKLSTGLDGFLYLVIGIRNLISVGTLSNPNLCYAIYQKRALINELIQEVAMLVYKVK
jgi:hypothetical protein